MVETTEALILSDSDLYEAWLRPVQDVIDSMIQDVESGAGIHATDLDESDLYSRMNTDALVDYLAEAMLAADVNGRIDKAGVFRGTGVSPVSLSDTLSLAEADPDNFLVTPETFGAAQRWLDQRVTLPTNLSSVEISSQWPADIRMQAFFSARVSSANILQSMRTMVDSVAAGDIGQAEAVKFLTEFLAKEGYGIPDPTDPADRDLKDLASTARLNLVIAQNVAMAHAVGQRAVSENSFVMETFPNYKYIANTDRHQAFDGIVLPKGDPFWQTHYPPIDFRCACIAVDDDTPINTQGALQLSPEGAPFGQLIGPNGQAVNVAQPESGFLFLSDPKIAFKTFDTSSIEDPDLRTLVDQDIAAARVEEEATPETPITARQVSTADLQSELDERRRKNAALKARLDELQESNKAKAEQLAAVEADNESERHRREAEVAQLQDQIDEHLGVVRRYENRIRRQENEDEN